MSVAGYIGRNLRTLQDLKLEEVVVINMRILFGKGTRIKKSKKDSSETIDKIVRIEEVALRNGKATNLDLTDFPKQSCYDYSKVTEFAFRGLTPWFSLNRV